MSYTKDTNKLSAYLSPFIIHECRFKTPATMDTHFNSWNNIYIEGYVEPGHSDGARVPSQATWMVRMCRHNDEICDRPSRLRSDTPQYLGTAKLITVHPTLHSHTLRNVTSWHVYIASQHAWNQSCRSQSDLCFVTHRFPYLEHFEGQTMYRDYAKPVKQNLNSRLMVEAVCFFWNTNSTVSHSKRLHSQENLKSL